MYGSPLYFLNKETGNKVIKFIIYSSSFCFKPIGLASQKELLDSTVIIHLHGKKHIIQISLTFDERKVMWNEMKVNDRMSQFG